MAVAQSTMTWLTLRHRGKPPPTWENGVYRRPARVLTSTHTASTRMLPLTIICQ